MNQQLMQRIRECPDLPTMPAIALQVLELTQKEDASVAEIAQVIGSDPALSSKILKTVNSSFYARTQTVSTIQNAVVILGMQSVKTLVLGFSLVSNLSKQKPKGKKADGFDHVSYWKRSIYAATAARTIAARVPGSSQVQAEECFLAALLMDIGMLVLDRVLGEPYSELLQKAATHNDLMPIEIAALELNHSQVADWLAETWKLPPVLRVPMANHHDATPIADEALRQLTRVVNLASRCADVFADEEASGAIKDVRETCQRLHHLTESECDLMLDEIGRRTSEVAPLFEVSVNAEPFENILRRANERLIELSLNTQRQAAELHTQAANLMQAATKLKAQNTQLRERAVLDPLTGIANRGSFDKFFADRFAQSLLEGKPLSVLMVDVDHFKQINDSHGHQVGDIVLQALAQKISQRLRPTDQAARYGGEEFVIVLPATTRQQASALAEVLRREIAGRPVPNARQDIPTTVSVGVATFEPGSQFREAQQLLQAADLAMYAAKKAGRNRVKVFASAAAAAAPVATASAPTPPAASAA